MRISHDGKELATLKYIRQAQEISKTHRANIKRHEQTARGGEMIAAIDKEHVTMLRKLCELHGQIQLQSFLAEGLLPNEAEQREICAEMEAIVRRGSGGENWNPRPATNDLLTRLAQSVCVDLANQVKQLDLEKRLTTSMPAATGDTYNLHVTNLQGGVQHGSGNIQNISVANNQTVSEILPQLAALIESIRAEEFPDKDDVVRDLVKAHEVALANPGATSKESAWARIGTKLTAAKTTMELAGYVIATHPHWPQIIEFFHQHIR